MQYRVQLRDGSPALLIEATRFETDGSGSRLYDSNDGIVAAFYDGQVASIFPADTLTEGGTTE